MGVVQRPLVPQWVLLDWPLPKHILGRLPSPQDVAIVELVGPLDTQAMKLVHRQRLEVRSESGHAAVAEAETHPQSARGAQMIVHVDPVGSGLHGLHHALAEVLAELRLLGTTPPVRDPFVPEIGQPRHFDRLPCEVAAKTLFVGLRETFVITGEFGDHAHTAKEPDSGRPSVGLGPRSRFATPGQDGRSIGLVGRTIGLKHEHNVRSFQLALSSRHFDPRLAPGGPVARKRAVGVGCESQHNRFPRPGRQIGRERLPMPWGICLCQFVTVHLDNEVHAIGARAVADADPRVESGRRGRQGHGEHCHRPAVVGRMGEQASS